MTRHLPPPATDSDDLLAAMRRTRTTPTPTVSTTDPTGPTTNPTTPATGPATDPTGSTTATSTDPTGPTTDPTTPATGGAGRPELTRRSWYLPRQTHAALSAAVDDLHHATRRPKWQCGAAVMRAGLDHLDDARALLDTLTTHE